jgi:hypothetical protein
MYWKKAEEESMSGQSESAQFWKTSVLLKQQIDGPRKSPIHASLKPKLLFKKFPIQAQQVNAAPICNL